MELKIKETPLSSKALPFTKLWSQIQKDNGNVGIHMYRVYATMNEALEYMRESPSDFLFIHGLGQDTEAVGLLCTEKPRQLADAESCFFVGEVLSNKTQGNYVFETLQLCDFLGNGASFQIGYPYLADEVEAEIDTAFSFVEAMRRDF